MRKIKTVSDLDQSHDNTDKTSEIGIIARKTGGCEERILGKNWGLSQTTECMESFGWKVFSHSNEVNICCFINKYIFHVKCFGHCVLFGVDFDLFFSSIGLLLVCVSVGVNTSLNRHDVSLIFHEC